MDARRQRGPDLRQLTRLKQPCADHPAYGGPGNHAPRAVHDAPVARRHDPGPVANYATADPIPVALGAGLVLDRPRSQLHLAFDREVVSGWQEASLQGRGRGSPFPLDDVTRWPPSIQGLRGRADKRSGCLLGPPWRRALLCPPPGSAWGVAQDLSQAGRKCGEPHSSSALHSWPDGRWLERLGRWASVDLYPRDRAQ